MMQKLLEKGVRFTLEAQEEIKKDEKLIEQVVALNKSFITKEDLDEIRNKTNKLEISKEAPSDLSADSVKVEILREPLFKPIAKEYSSNIQVTHTRDVTGKSRSKGEVGDFISYFRDRYEKLAKMLRGGIRHTTIVDLKDLKHYKDQKVKVIVSVFDKRETKKGNVMLEVEDLTGTFKVIISKNSSHVEHGKDNNSKEKVWDKVGYILKDDVIAITGKAMEAFLIAEEVEWPDLPVMRERKTTENDLGIVYISDIHYGSRYFLSKYFDYFTEWLQGKGEAKDIASKVKYVVVAGDIVDGIGVYPNQEKELTIKDIYKQYEMFDDFLERVPDYIEVIVGPGNHDAVRRGEPMPAIPKDLIKNDRIVRIGNPSTVNIEGLKHLIYHGTSMDSLIACLPNASYAHPEKVMVEYLKRRHLSPIYPGNLIIPEKIDYFVIEDEPDVFHSGHVHKNGYTAYRGTLVINSGTFQDQTEYQVKQGHIPTPAMVPFYETKYGKLRTLDFKS